MLKLHTSYGKKVPAEQEYSSKSYHCSVELELSDTLDAATLQDRIHETFELVKASVEAEIHETTSEAPVRAAVSQNTPGPRATNKQIKFILDLGKNQGMGLSEINDQVRGEFGADSVYELDRKSASRLLDQLKAA